MRICNKIKICIICEGQEEKYYIDKLKDKGVFSNIYDIKTINAKGITNIFSRYQDKYQSDSYPLVLIFCDTDKKSNKQYYPELKKKVNEFHDNNVANKVIIFGNPCTMQIILSHFAEVKLRSQSKNQNKDLIKELTGIEEYDAKEEQVIKLTNKITQANYKKMKENISKMPSDDSKKPSTNILGFLKNLESDDTKWIDEINKEL